jgi:L-threonylcarbamoyladenylate synthase
MSEHKIKLDQIRAATSAIKQGEIIAYPTEAVYGLGVDPTQEAAVEKLYKLKQRDPNKGCIIVAASWGMVKHFTRTIPNYDKVFASWPGHVTWVFPASSIVPRIVQNPDNTVAIRVSNHPIIQSLCQELDAPIVSTSANMHNGEPAKTAAEVAKIFGNNITTIIDAKIGSNHSVSTIKNAINGEILR